MNTRRKGTEEVEKGNGRKEITGEEEEKIGEIQKRRGKDNHQQQLIILIKSGIFYQSFRFLSSG